MANSFSARRSSFGKRKADPVSYERCEPRLLLASFAGTGGNDLVSVTVGVNSAEIVVNGSATTVAAPDVIDIDGLAGFDRLEISRAAGVDAAFENGRFEIGGFSIDFANIDQLSFDGSFTVVGTAGDDVIELRHDVQDPAIIINGTTHSFPNFYFRGATINVDGGGGEDQLISSAFDTEVFPDRNGGLSWVNVEKVDLDVSELSFNDISLFGTDGDDTLNDPALDNPNDGFATRNIFSPSQGPQITLFEGFSSFDFSLTVHGGGGNDSAFLRHSFNDFVSFSGSPTSSRLFTAGSSGNFSVTVEGFENVTADVFGSVSITGSEGNDTAVYSRDVNSPIFSGNLRSIEVAGESFSIDVNTNTPNATVRGGGGNDTIEIGSDSSLFFTEEEFVELRRLSRRDFRFEGFSEVNFAGDEVPSFNSTGNEDFDLDFTGSKTTLSNNGVAFNIPVGDGVELLGSANDSLSVIAPPSASVAVDALGFEVLGVRSSVRNFDSVSFEGHDDGSGITITGGPQSERLDFDGSDVVFSSDLQTISTSNFTETSVNARGGVADIATLTGVSSGGNSFVASFDGAISTGTLTTPERTVTAVGFDALDAIAADPSDQVSIIGGALRETAILGVDQFEYAIGNQSISGSGFTLVDIAGGGGNDEVLVEHDFNVSLTENDIGLHLASVFRDPSYQLTEFSSISFGDLSPRVAAIGSSANLVADYSGATSVFQRTGNPTEILTTGDFEIFGTSNDNDNLLIIAPEQEDSTLLFNQFLTDSVVADWRFVENITVQGHDNSSAINILGNAGDDILIFNGEETFLDLSIGIDLAATDFNVVNVNPRGGNDRAFLRGAAGGDNLFEGGVDAGVLTTPSTIVTATDFELVSAIAGGGNDQAIFGGGLNPENFFAGPATARLVGANFSLNAAGFNEVIADGGQGDFANLTDSSGDDQFTATSDSATIVFAGGASVTTNNFTSVRSVSAAGQDEALLEGSAGDDRFVAVADRFGRLTGTGYSVIAVSYPAVAADGLSGNDIAFLSGSTGDDSFVAAQGNSVLSGNGFENTAINFESVSGFASQGNDSAEFRGTQADETFFSSPAVASLTSNGFFLFGGGFDSVTAIGGGGQDVATLRDSSGNDTFTGNNSTAVLTGAGFRNEAAGFATVRAFSTSGFDRTFFTGSSGNDEFVGRRPFSYLDSGGVRVQANGFNNVSVMGLAGNDTASLFDTDEDETFFGSGSNARLEGETYGIQLVDFEVIDVFGFNGGVNSVGSNLNNVDFVFRSFGEWNI